MYKKEENYCTFSPDEILGARFNQSCYWHDRQYRDEIKHRKTRFQADLDLRNGIFEHLKNSDETFKISLKIKRFKINISFLSTEVQFLKDTRKRLAYPLSRIYYHIVRLFGGWTWND